MKFMQARFLILSLMFSLGPISACTNLATPSQEPSSASGTEMPAGGDMDAGNGMNTAMDDIPADLNTEKDRVTDQGLFQATITSNMNPIDINQTHTWTLHLATPDGEAISDAEVAIAGGMPQHNHGFPTAPQVTENLGEGDYLVEGVRFNMTGWWEMTFDISANGQSDTITFNIVVQTGHSQE